jgi:hypothetical protein
VALQDIVVHDSCRALARIGLSHLAPSPEDIWPYVKRATLSLERSATGGDMAQMFYSHDGRLAHKWDHYQGIYDRHLARFCGTASKFLEIRVSHSGLLQIWRKYFGPNATIFGVDVDPRCSVVDDPPSINVRIGSQTDVASLRSVVAEMGDIDVVLDDGSHYFAHQRATFDALFPLLSAEGVYIVEHLQTNYWRGRYQGGWRLRSTFLEQMKDLIDDMNAWWHTRRQRRPDAHRIVDAVHFYNRKEAAKAEIASTTFACVGADFYPWRVFLGFVYAVGYLLARSPKNFKAALDGLLAGMKGETDCRRIQSLIILQDPMKKGGRP